MSITERHRDHSDRSAAPATPLSGRWPCRWAGFALLVGLAAACDGPGSGGLLAVNGGGAGDDEVADCDAIVGAPEEMAALEFFDAYRGNEETPRQLTLDGCLVEESLSRSGAVGLGFLPGERTLSIALDGKEVASSVIQAEPGDEFYYALDTNSPPQLHRATGSMNDTPERGWLVSLMNVTGEDITVYEVATSGEMALLGHGIGHGETVSGHFEASAGAGVRIRIEREGEAIFDDNIGFLLGCESDGGFPVAGVRMFAIVSADIGPSAGVVHGGDACQLPE